MASVASQILLFGFAGFGAIVVYRLVAAGGMTGLLVTRRDGPLDPERVQMLAVALASVVAYAVLGIRRLPEILADPSLPDAPQWLLAIAGGSQALYLAGKIARAR